MSIDFADVLREKFGEKLDEARIERDHMEDLIKEQDIYFIENQKAGMLIRRKKQEWTTIPGFCKNYGIMNQKDFEMMIRVLDHNKVRVVNTFKNSASNELNLMSKDAWIDSKHIVEGELDPMTDALLDSLSGGDAEARIHIMQWIGWKYLRPDDFMLPALSIYGAQSVGKGVFTYRVLPTIFGSRQVYHAKGDEIIGSFNDQAIIGRSIVCVDESNLSKKTDDRLKQLIGNPKVTAHPKGLTPFEVDNCIAYVFTSNDLFGGMKLDSDADSNRRFSMIQVQYSLRYWMEKSGYNYDELMNNDTITKHFSDPVEIGKLLHQCIAIAKLQNRPLAFHGQDYQEMVEAQHPLNEFFEEQFNGKDKFVIVNENFYDEYKEWKVRSDPAGFIMSQTKLTQETKKWSLTHLPELRHEVRSVIGKSKRVWVKD